MKRLVAIGDSIVHGTCSTEPFGLIEENFIKIISKEFCFDEVLNYGMNGTTISTDTEWRSTLAMCVYIDEMFPADSVIIAGGTNDYGNNIEIGNIEDKTDKTFYGALKILFDKVTKKYKNVVVITPIKRKIEGKNLKFYTLNDYRNAIKEVAKKYSFFVINGEDIPLNFEEHILDGLHPNSFGHKVYAEYVSSILKSKKWR